MTQLTSVTVKGVRWTYLAGAAGIAVQIPYAAAMARLLTPADFGLMALAHLVLRFAHNFAQGGLRSAVVQRPSLTGRDVRVIFALALTAGSCSFAVIWLIAPCATELLRGPAELTSLIRTAALILVFMALGAPATGLLSRGMRYRAIAFTDFFSFVVGYCVIGISSALLGAGVWSLVYGTLGWYLLQALLPYLMVRHSLLPLFDVRAMHEVMRFGGKVSVNGFLEYLTEDFGKLVIGRYVGVTAAGLYDRAALLASLPLQQIQAAAGKVLLPAFSRIQNESNRLSASYADCAALTTLVLFPLWAVIGASSEQLVALLLGSQWRGSAELVPILGLVSALSLVTQFSGTLVEAIGAVGRKLVISVVQLLVLVAGTALALFLGCGVHGLMVVVLASQLVKQALFHAWLNRLFPATRRPVAEAYAQAAGLTVLIWVALWSVQGALEGGCPVALVLAAKAATAGALVLGCLRYGAGLHGVRVARERGLLPGKLSRQDLKEAC
ncbi:MULTISPECIES: oligosaccharide flippase family protein [unclassified Streptomyces]|uniref:oligosaccharide flippase family protein n=1 Tax=unclassified Streptomyces TaxID=2593676 RepID=UPI0022546F73|nr:MULTISPECIES: oligosaccharide flippase family protein [unclassified Streptomyces]MCX5060159.1 oligosaccharide flippase family protein [Streptomyces sp. NBC_00452]